MQIFSQDKRMSPSEDYIFNRFSYGKTRVV